MCLRFDQGGTGASCVARGVPSGPRVVCLRAHVPRESAQASGEAKCASTGSPSLGRPVSRSNRWRTSRHFVEERSSVFFRSSKACSKAEARRFGERP